MQRALRNQGKPISVVSLDKREDARQKPSANPVVKDLARLDQDREKMRAAQARQEQHQGSSDDNETEFDVQDRH